MMRRVFTVCLAGALVLGLSGCVVRRVEDEPARNESRDVSGFDEVSFSGYGDLRIEQGRGYALEVSGPANVLDRLTTEVRGDTLYIEWEARGVTWFGYSGDPKLEVTLVVPELSRLEVAGAGDATVDGLDAEEFEFELSGAGKVSLEDIDVEKLVLKLSGAGSAEASGRATAQEVDISGVGAYDGRDLKTDTAQIEMSGAGSAIVWVMKTLDVELSGAGSVEYYGAPKLTEDISGIGSVESRGPR